MTGVSPSGAVPAVGTAAFHQLDDADQVAALEAGRTADDPRVRLIAGWLLRHHLATRTTYHRAVMGTRTKGVTWLDYLAGRGRELLTATVDDVDGWVRTLLTAGCAPSTVVRDLAALRGLYAHAVRTGLLAENPATDAASPTVDTEGTTPVIARREAAALLTAAETASPRDLAVTGLLLIHGLRSAEVAALDRTNLAGTNLQFVGKGGKTRPITLAPRIATAITVHLAERDDAAMHLLDANDGGRLTRQQIQRISARLGRAAGIDRTVRPHQLRATLATELLDANTALRDVQIVLGHADPRTTARYDRRDRRRVLEAAALTADGLFTS